MSRKAKRFAPMARGRLGERIAEAATFPSGDALPLRRPANAVFEAFARDDNSEAIIDIYDVIGSWELNAASFRRLLNSISAPRITVRINSPGGLVFDGFAMYEDLRAHGAHITTHVTGIAASAASIVALAGDEIVIAENGFLMIHNAWVVAMGDKGEMSKAARLLTQIDKRLAKTYAGRMGITEAKAAEYMDAETWFDSEQAVKVGLADTIAAPVKPEALSGHDLSHFAKAPGALKATPKAPTAPTPAPVETPAAVDYTAAVAALDRLSKLLR